jgi:hypothetical protein
MCLGGAGAWSVNGFLNEESENRGLTRPAAADLDRPSPSPVFGCSGCADVGYCRRGLDADEFEASVTGALGFSGAAECLGS